MELNNNLPTNTKPKTTAQIKKTEKTFSIEAKQQKQQQRTKKIGITCE